MKKYLIALVLLVFSSGIYAQQINYQKNLNQALALAAKKNKPAFILVTTPGVPGSPTDADSIPGLASKQAVQFYNKNFISYRASVRDTSINSLRTKYNLTVFPACLFLDNKGQVVDKTVGNYKTPNAYIAIAKSALARIKQNKTIGYYKQLDTVNKLNRDQLKDYITLKQNLGLFDNALLIDKYVGFLTINQLDDYKQVLFILKAGPIYASKAYTLSYSNRKVYDSLFKTEPLPIRQDINKHIINNTRNEAIRTKNATMAQYASTVARSSWSTNYLLANKAATYEMVMYYKAVKDTANYYRQTSYYIDSYILNISADSARKLQLNTTDKMKATALSKVSAAPTLPIPGVTTSRITMTTIVSAPQPYNVANILNDAAFDFYTADTRNVNYLFKAMTWSRRSIELSPDQPPYYDTMAHIMYRLNFYDEALLNQKKALELAIAQPRFNSLVKLFQTELEKMKQRVL